MTRFRNLLVAAGAALALCVPAAAQVQAAKPSAVDLKTAVAHNAAKVVVPINPCACLKELVDWCKQTTVNKVYCLSYNFTLHSNNGLLGYSEGWLFWNPSKAGFVQVAVNGDPWWMNEARDGAGQPFNRPPLQRNVLEVHANSCTVGFKIGANATITSPPLQCSNGFYYAFAPQRGELYVLTFKKQSYEPPK